MDVTTRLRAACGHDSRSVDGCTNCEAADEIERLRVHAVTLANTVHEGARALVVECQAALAEELSAWDIDPPLHHVKQAHDRCTAWLDPRVEARSTRADWAACMRKKLDDLRRYQEAEVLPELEPPSDEAERATAPAGGPA